jgi:DNA-binding transcriptional MerR regulator
LARELQVSRRTIARYAEQGLLVPAFTLPSGHHRWRLSEVQQRLRELRRRDAE